MSIPSYINMSIHLQPEPPNKIQRDSGTPPGELGIFMVQLNEYHESK